MKVNISLLPVLTVKVVMNNFLNQKCKTVSVSTLLWCFGSYCYCVRHELHNTILYHFDYTAIHFFNSLHNFSVTLMIRKHK